MQGSAELAGHGAYPVRIRLALECLGIVWSSRWIIAQDRDNLVAIKDLQEVVVYRDNAKAEHGEDSTSTQRIPIQRNEN